jgi:Flp pilus assembly protein TadD
MSISRLQGPGTLAVAAFAAGWLFASPVAAQQFPEDRRNESGIANPRSGDSSFSVQVLPAPGEKTLPPLVVVELEGLTGGNTRVQWVQGTGVARFEDVAGGSYTVRARCDEFQDVEQTLFVPPSLRGRSTLILTLGARRTEAKPTGPSGNVVPVAKLASPPQAAIREFQKGLAESNRRHPDRAVAHLEKALGRHPDYFEALTLLGDQYVRLRRLPEAASAYERALRVDPGHASTHFNLGLVALETRDLRAARLHFIQAASIDGTNAGAYFYLGETYFQAGDFTNAIRSYLRAAQQQTDHVDALFRLGVAYDRVRQPAAAGSFYRRFLDREPSGPRAEQVRARLASLRPASAGARP